MDFSDRVGEFPTKFISGFFNVLQVVVVIFAVLAVLYLFAFTPHEVVGRSMDPNFAEGQFLLAEKFSFYFGEPKQGQVVVFEYDDRHDYIKRVIAVPGDTVYVSNCSVYVNGAKLDEREYLESTVCTDYGNYMTSGRTITIEEGSVFVLGDNRPHSSDSRNFGPIDIKKIKGRPILRLTPLDKIGIIPVAKY